jgi:hypothetical protein
VDVTKRVGELAETQGKIEPAIIMKITEIGTGSPGSIMSCCDVIDADLFRGRRRMAE